MARLASLVPPALALSAHLMHLGEHHEPSDLPALLLFLAYCISTLVSHFHGHRALAFIECAKALTYALILQSGFEHFEPLLLIASGLCSMIIGFAENRSRHTIERTAGTLYFLLGLAEARGAFPGAPAVLPVIEVGGYALLLLCRLRADPHTEHELSTGQRRAFRSAAADTAAEAEPDDEPCPRRSLALLPAHAVPNRDPRCDDARSAWPAPEPNPWTGWPPNPDGHYPSRDTCPNSGCTWSRSTDDAH